MKRLLLLLLAGVLTVSVAFVSFAAEETADGKNDYSDLGNLSETELIELRNAINNLLGDNNTGNAGSEDLAEYVEITGITESEEAAIQIIDAYRKAYMRYPESLTVYDVYLDNIAGQDFMYKIWMDIGGTDTFGSAFRHSLGILITRDKEIGETFSSRIKEAFVINDMELNTDQLYEHLDAERIDQYFKNIDR